eukprot:505608_1
MTSWLKFIIVASLIFYHSSYAETVTCPHKGSEAATCKCKTDISNTACDLKCVGWYQCYQDSVNCRSGDNCIVECDGDGACQDATITCPSDASCTVKCAISNNANVCSGVTINNIDTTTNFKCEGCPTAYTPSPTPSPTTHMPTIATSSPTNKPTSPPTTRPTHPPSNDPTTRPTKSPTQTTHSP